MGQIIGILWICLQPRVELAHVVRYAGPRHPFAATEPYLDNGAVPMTHIVVAGDTRHILVHNFFEQLKEQVGN